MKYTERVGTKINHLTILEITGKRNTGKRTKILCKVRCDCGSEFETLIESVVSEQTQSCGCKRKKHANSALSKVYTNYKNSAKNRHYDFSLTLDDLEFITSQKCFYCGSDPSNIKEIYGDTYKYNGIDRVDNTRGYELGNVITCCEICNRAKRDMKYEDFVAWLWRAAKQWQSK